MAMKRAFISFDFDHDEDLRNALVAQAKNPDSPFRIADWSLHEPFDSNWRTRVRERIRRTDFTIVLCGEHTHRASGVAAELTITQEERKPYFLLKGRRSKQCFRPTTAPKSKVMHPWTWLALRQLIANPR